MAERGKLQIHTRMGPQTETAALGETPEAAMGRSKWKRLPHPKAKRRGFAFLRFREQAGDRLLRNAAVACALLLGIMALKNAELPWAKTAALGIEKAVTMKIDLDESLGRLHFARNLVPEAALVFWNAGASNRLQAPVEGEVYTAYEQDRPWVVYSCAGGSKVKAAHDGQVQAVERGSAAEYIVILMREDGMESVYAYMAETSVKAGDTLYAGDTIGVTASGEGSQLYFALRVNGQSADPAEYM